LVVRSKTGNDLNLRYNGKVVTIKTKANTVYNFNGELKTL
jgi:hypothetical protein